jgi:hypothetical protein
MSLFEPLLRFVDVIAFRKKQDERQRKRKAQPPGVPDDEEVEVPPSRPPAALAPLTCRVCGYRGGPEHKFCPRCLAETMERRR